MAVAHPVFKPPASDGAVRILIRNRSIALDFSAVAMKISLGKG